MVLGGGGFRFGIYIGMYAALRQAGRAPDVLLASCGGAIAATIIHNLPDPEAQRAWLSSPEMYQFWCSLKSTQRADLMGSLMRAAKRKLSTARAPVIPDLFGDYLFEIPPQLPFPPATGTPEVDVAIIGGKLLFDESDVGQPRAGRKLFAQTVFCGEQAAALLHNMQSPLSDARWGQHAVAQDLLVDGSVPLTDAARISIADMIYFRCQQHRGQEYIGGVLDLFPVEIARRLGAEVVMEFKEAFDQVFAIPAWRSVLGIDGNARLRYANIHLADMRIDTSDVSLVLAKQQLQQKLDWRRNRIELAMPPTYDTFVQHMNDQWQYGYDRATEALAHPPGKHPAIRRSTRYSKPLRSV
ncbi:MULTISPECIES: patatin-like phospholipase family protein [unclassified Duganella]|uniref:patatin-like phospholipase family protein n=1 Tax=unclassified Duganella TaxID=2636909 RepID=UPI000E34BEC6|nr:MULTISPECIES: patatin-like phospholipase family protein [unclassified Duganella]RFP16154.1 patatin-like phospholipase family protein [Duganella sp. BJB475]RFP32683.1 patatin-like phospholipase family protein [Duganella sp. BJB476]